MPMYTNQSKFRMMLVILYAVVDVGILRMFLFNSGTDVITIMNLANYHTATFYCMVALFMVVIYMAERKRYENLLFWPIMFLSITSGIIIGLISMFGVGISAVTGVAAACIMCLYFNLEMVWKLEPQCRAAEVLFGTLAVAYVLHAIGIGADAVGNFALLLPIAIAAIWQRYPRLA